MDTKPILLLVVVACCYTAYLTLSSPYPNMRDAWFHILVARAYYRGNVGMTSPIVMDINLVPYPPLYHLLLAPFTDTLQHAIDAQRVLQTLFYPLGLLAAMLVASNRTHTRRGLLYGGLLWGSYFAFSLMQGRPQALATILYLTGLFALQRGKPAWWTASTVTMFYTYSPYALALAAAPAFIQLRQNWKNRYVWLAILLVAPMLAYQASFLFDANMAERWLTRGDLGIAEENALVFANPLYWLLNGLGISVAGIVLVFVDVYRWADLPQTDRIMVTSLFTSLMLLPVWYARVLSFAVIPLAYVTAKYVTSRSGWRFAFLVSVVAVQMIVFALFPVWWMSPPDYVQQYW